MSPCSMSRLISALLALMMVSLSTDGIAVVGRPEVHAACCRLQDDVQPLANLERVVEREQGFHDATSSNASKRSGRHC